MSAEPPLSADIVCEEREAGVTFHIVPVGFRRAGGSIRGWGTWMAFALANATLAALFTLAALAALIRNRASPSGPDWGGLLGALCFWSVPATFFLVGWHAGNTRTTLDARNGILSIDQAGPWRSQHSEFKREEIYAIYQGLPEFSASEGPPPDIPVLVVATIKDRPRRFLVFQPDRFCQWRLLAGRTQAEIEWIADTLKRVLHLPPSKPMTFWQWLRRNSPQ